VRCLLFLAALAGCDDTTGGCSQPPPGERTLSGAPSIRQLSYMPNAGFVGDDNMFSGSMIFSDSDADLSQGVVEISDPKGNLVIRSEPTPLMGATGISGNADFQLTLDKTLSTEQGIYHMCVWVVDLAAHESNHIGGEIRMAVHSPYDNMNNP